MTLNSVCILLCIVTLTGRGQANGDITGSVTCDNDVLFFANGNPISVAHATDWTKAGDVTLSSGTTVLAIQCHDRGYIAGIKATFDNGVVTDHTWKCSATMELGWNNVGFNDDSWANAVTHTHTAWGNNPIGLGGSWIYTSNWNGIIKNGVIDKDVYCRKEISGSGTPPPPVITGYATCDNQMEFFADGVLLAQHNDWRIATPIALPIDTKVIGIKCVDLHVIAGIKAAFENGVKTDSSWKCSTTATDGWSEEGYDITDWVDAVTHTDDRWGDDPIQLHNLAYWIWTQYHDFQDKTVYCRKELPCQHHDVRLVQGPNKYEGIAQLCVNGKWGYICDGPGFHKIGWPSVFCNTLNKKEATFAKFTKKHRPDIKIPKDAYMSYEMPSCFTQKKNKMSDCNFNDNNQKCKKPWKKTVWVTCDQ